MTLCDSFTSKVAAAALVGATLTSSAWAQDNTVAQSVTVPSTHQSAGYLPDWFPNTYDPLLPLPAIGALGVVFFLAAGGAALGRRRGALPRIAAGAAFCLALINPQRDHTLTESPPTDVMIVIDKSPSQSLGDRTAQTQKAYTELVKKLSAIKDINIHTVEVGGEKNNKTGDGTNIFTALDQALIAIPPERRGALFVLSDGDIHDIPANHKNLGENVPLHALISGQDKEFDRRIVIDHAEKWMLVNTIQKIAFRIIDDGPVPGSKEKIHVIASQDGKELGSQDVTVGQAAEMDIDTLHIGTNQIEFKTNTILGETTDKNNRAIVSVDGTREPLKILVVSGSPTRGLRTLHKILKKNIDTIVIPFVVMRTASQMDATPAEQMALVPYPIDQLFDKKLNKFDLIVLDHVINAGAITASTYMQNIATFVVQNGRSLLVIPGSEYAGDEGLYTSDLKSVLPVPPTGKVTNEIFTPEVSIPGQRHPVTRALDASSWGRWFQIVDSATPTGDILMEGRDKKPLLVLDHKGKGRVVMIMSDKLPAKLLENIVNWLLKDPAFEEEALRLREDNGSIIVEQQTMVDKNAPVTLQTPSGKNVNVTLISDGHGLWSAKLPALEFGAYSAQQSGSYSLRTFINIGPSDAKEFSKTISTMDLLKPLVSDTKGKIAWMSNSPGQISIPNVVPIRGDNKAMAGDDWMGVRMTDATIVKAVDRTPLSPWWPIGAGFGFLGLALFRESETSLFKKKSLPGPEGPSL